jgi:hypothetical protein
MNLKTTFLAPFLILIALAAPAHAQIPVTDGAHIGTSVMNQVETIMQWVEQLEQMEAQLKQAEKELEALRGSGTFGKFDDSTDLHQIVANFREANNYDSYRSKYPTADTPKANAVYDTMARQNATYNNLYSGAQEAMQNIRSLQSQISAAQDPGDKLDLANQLQTEQMKLSATMNMMYAHAQTSAAEMKQAQTEARLEFACRQFGHEDC